MVHPLMFYSWRVWDFATILPSSRRVIRYRPTMARVMADPARMSCTDEAMTLLVVGTEDHFVQHYADKTPRTQGAPVKHNEPAREIVAAE